MRCRLEFFPLVLLMSAEAMAGGVVADIGISGQTYTPNEAIVEAGEIINFAASGAHPLRFDDNEDIGCGQSCNVIFRTPGEYGFYCDNHGSPGAGMFGTVTVIASTIEDRVFIDPFELSFD